jgi:hypothetical protein
MARVRLLMEVAAERTMEEVEGVAEAKAAEEKEVVVMVALREVAGVGK